MWDIRERILFTENLRNFNVWNKKQKSNKREVTKKVIRDCPIMSQSKDYRMDQMLHQNNELFFFCKYYILQKRTAGEKMHLKSSFKNKRSIIPYILHICYTIIHSDHKTKWQASQYSWLFVCFSTQYTTILISFHYF